MKQQSFGTGEVLPQPSEYMHRRIPSAALPELPDNLALDEMLMGNRQSETTSNASGFEEGDSAGGTMIITTFELISAPHDVKLSLLPRDSVVAVELEESESELLAPHSLACKAGNGQSVN
jgi:hypothetical protein